MKRPMLAAVALAVAVAPSAASAASLEMRPTPSGSAVIAYDAAPGEVNRVNMSGTIGPGDFRMGFFEFSAPLTAGAGCVAGVPVVCGVVDQAFPVIATLGDQKDVANLNSLTSNLTLDAGSGSDDVFAGGIDASADGGDGNDTIRVAANNLAEGAGGAGNDKISGGLGAAAAILDGGPGNDLLVPGGFLFNNAQGGIGDDRLVSLSGSGITLSGQSGRDLLVATGGSRVTLDGGSYSDIIASKLGGVTVDAGSGHDVIDVRGPSDGAADTVTCGTGWDIVRANGVDDVADDCEVELSFSGGTLPSVADAVDDAQDLLDHMPDPSDV